LEVFIYLRENYGESMAIDKLNSNIILKQLNKNNNLSRKQNINNNSELSKNGSVFGARRNAETTSTSGSSHTFGTENNAKSAHSQSVQKGDISNVDFSSLNLYSGTELQQIKENLSEMLDQNIDRSTYNSLKQKLGKVNQAIQGKNLNSSATQANDIKNTENSNSAGNTPSATNTKTKKAADQEDAKKAYENAKSGLGGVGLAATLAATVKETKAGEETKKATSLMESEHQRMEKQAEANAKKNEKLQANMEKLNQTQTKEMKKQADEEAKIQEQQNQMMQTSAEIEEMSGSFNVEGAKSEEEAQDMQKSFNSQVDAKSETITSKNTQIGQSQRKLSSINKQYKNNIKTNSAYQRETAQLSKANNMSMNIASSNISQAQTTSGKTTGIAEKAGQIGQLSTAMGQAVSTTGQALEKNPYTAALGAAMHTYGDITAAAGSVTSAVSGTVQRFSSDTGEAAGNTRGKVNLAAGINRRTDIQGKTFKTQGKTLATQTTAQNKAAQRVTQEARNTFAASIDAVSNSKNTATVSASVGSTKANTGMNIQNAAASLGKANNNQRTQGFNNKNTNNGVTNSIAQNNTNSLNTNNNTNNINSNSSDRNGMNINFKKKA